MSPRLWVPAKTTKAATAAQYQRDGETSSPTTIDSATATPACTAWRVVGRKVRGASGVAGSGSAGSERGSVAGVGHRQRWPCSNRVLVQGHLAAIPLRRASDPSSAAPGAPPSGGRTASPPGCPPAGCTANATRCVPFLGGPGCPPSAPATPRSGPPSQQRGRPSPCGVPVADAAASPAQAIQQHVPGRRRRGPPTSCQARASRSPSRSAASSHVEPSAARAPSAYGRAAVSPSAAAEAARAGPPTSSAVVLSRAPAPAGVPAERRPPGPPVRPPRPAAPGDRDHQAVHPCPERAQQPVGQRPLLAARRRRTPAGAASPPNPVAAATSSHGQLRRPGLEELGEEVRHESRPCRARTRAARTAVRTPPLPSRRRTRRRRPTRWGARSVPAVTAHRGGPEHQQGGPRACATGRARSTARLLIIASTAAKIRRVHGLPR